MWPPPAFLAGQSGLIYQGKVESFGDVIELVFGGVEMICMKEGGAVLGGACRLISVVSSLQGPFQISSAPSIFMCWEWEGGRWGN